MTPESKIVGLQPGLLPLVTGGSVTSSARGNVGVLFPSVPAGTPSPSAQPPARSGRPAPVAEVGPLGRRQVGTQLIALAVLFAAIGIMIAKLTLRTPRPSVAARNAARGVTSPGGGSGKGDPAAADAAGKGVGPSSNSGSRL
jgi:hypothetical protein